MSTFFSTLGQTLIFFGAAIALAYSIDPNQAADGGAIIITIVCCPAVFFGLILHKMNN